MYPISNPLFAGPLDNPCLQALNVGVGNSNLDRWYFDTTSRRCLKFFYRGLQGNQNNFLSMSDCENLCLSTLHVCLSLTELTSNCLSVMY